MIVSHLHGFASTVTAINYTSVSLITRLEDNVTFKLCLCSHYQWILTCKYRQHWHATCYWCSSTGCLKTCEQRLLATSCPPVCQQRTTRLHLYELSLKFHISGFLKSVEKLQASLKSDKSNRYFTWRPTYIYDNTYIDEFFLGWEMIQTNSKIKTHFMSNNTFPKIVSCIK
jgi:hypothetical protein